MLELAPEAFEQFPVLRAIVEQDYYDEDFSGAIEIPWDHKNWYLIKLIVPDQFISKLRRLNIIFYNAYRRQWQQEQEQLNRNQQVSSFSGKTTKKHELI
jgi:hypothetical protein